MTKKERLAKIEKDYYDSIRITPAEYRATVAEANKHHRHVFRANFSPIGVVFYECACGAKHAGVYDGD